MRALASSSGVSTPSGTLVHHHHIDAHAGIERAQLLELLALLVGRRRQLDEALQRRAPIGVKPDVVIMRARAGGVGAGERGGAQAAGCAGAPIAFTTFGLLQLGRIGDDRRERRDIDGRIGQRAERGADVGGLDGRQIALHIDHHADAMLGIERLQRLVDAVGAGDVIGPCHDRAAAGLFHRRGDRFGIGRHHRLADLGGERAAQHVHDHRQPGDIRQWLAGQAGGGHAGRDEDDGVGHRFGHRRQWAGPERMSIIRGAYTGCQS